MGLGRKKKTKSRTIPRKVERSQGKYSHGWGWGWSVGESIDTTRGGWCLGKAAWKQVLQKERKVRKPVPERG
jgi:hypothetical protein